VFAAGVWVLGVDLARKNHPVMPTFSFAVAVGVLEANLARQLNPAMPAFAYSVIPVILDLAMTALTFAAGV
jgi:hypothetical protein